MCGLDLEQPLQHASGLARREVAVEDDEARESGAVDAEVGEGEADTLADLGADREIAAELPGQCRRVGHPLRLGRQFGMGRVDRAAGQRRQPAGR